MRSVVASGARRLQAQLRGEEFWLTFDGPGLAFSESVDGYFASEPRLSTFVNQALGAGVEFVRFVRPLGGVEFRIQGGGGIPLPGLRGPWQVNVKLKPAPHWTGRLWRQLSSPLRAFQEVFQKPTPVELDLNFNYQPVQSDFQYPLGKVEFWSQGCLPFRARFALFEPSIPPPQPLHAIFGFDEEGPGEIRWVLDGLEAPPLSLPWPGFRVLCSVGGHGLEPAEEDWTENGKIQELTAWLKHAWVEACLQARPTPLQEARLRRWTLEPGPDFPKASLQRQPIFWGKSLLELREKVHPLGAFPELEVALQREGVPIYNPQLRDLLAQEPRQVPGFVAQIWDHHRLAWALPKVLHAYSQHLGAGDLLQTFQELRQPKSWRHKTPDWGGFCRRVRRFLEGLPDSENELLPLAYLEAVLLTPNRPASLTVRQALADEFRPYLERLSQGNLVRLDGAPGQVAQRLWLGLREYPLSWKGQFLGNSLAIDHFLALSILRPPVQAQDAYFSEIREEGGVLVCPLGGEDEIRIHLGSGQVKGRFQGRTLDFLTSDVKDWRRLSRSHEGDEKTHFYETLAFSDGVYNYLLEERGKEYHSPLYSQSDTVEQVRTGLQRFLGALQGSSIVRKA